MDSHYRGELSYHTYIFLRVYERSNMLVRFSRKGTAPVYKYTPCRKRSCTVIMLHSSKYYTLVYNYIDKE